MDPQALSSQSTMVKSGSKLNSRSQASGEITSSMYPTSVEPGGNLIVMQVGDPGTAKGDPRFMQGLQEACSKASQQTKNELSNCVTVRDGRPIRIAAPKDFPKLEAFVRTFADGKAYIGVGAWGSYAGNPNNNKQVFSSSFIIIIRQKLIMHRVQI
jgi:hypothetical protein